MKLSQPARTVSEIGVETTDRVDLPMRGHEVLGTKFEYTV